MKPTRRSISSDTIARQIFVQLLSRVVGGTIELVDRRGTRRFGDPRPVGGHDPIHARLVVHDERLYARLLRDGSVGLGDAYADGWWEADDLAGVLRLAHRNLTRTHALRDRMHRSLNPVLDPIARLRRADKQRDRDDIHAHYDLGNDLFRRVLDHTMMYSCGVFDSLDDSLEQASLAKVDRLARVLQLSPGDRVLEIGTGWGGFAIHAASTYGCHVTTTTLSEEQYEFARMRVRDAGLEHLVEVRGDDYRDITGTYDKMIAIEMIEAVDWREYPTFFAACQRLLSEHGLLAMQAIVIPDRSFDRAKRRTDFIKAAIFPGSSIPSVGALTAAANESGNLSLVHLDDIGVHYGETLRRWKTNLVERQEELALFGYDEHFIRLWEFYFTYCEAGFDERYCSVTQLAYAAPKWRPAPFAAELPAPRTLSTV